MIDIQEFALKNIDNKLSEIPDSKLVDKDVVVNLFLDLRLELLALGETETELAPC